MDAIKRLAERLNYPSAAKLKSALRAEGLPFDPEEVDRLQRGQASRQVQAPTTRWNGRIVAEQMDSKWFADLIDFSAAPSTGKGERYILCCQDVFSRYLWTRALMDKKPSTTADAFLEILSEAAVTPGMLKTDAGSEWGGTFGELLALRGIHHAVKEKGDQRAIATLDVAIGQLKAALARVMRTRRNDNWATLLPGVTEGQNELPSKHYLGGTSAAKVRDSELVQGELEEKNAQFDEEADALMAARQRALERAGYFRVRLMPNTFQRVFKPRWGETVHRVGRVVRQHVYDVQGRRYLTKLTQPVQTPGETSEPASIERAGDSRLVARRRGALGDLVPGVLAWLGERDVALSQLGVFLNARDFKRRALEAHLTQKAPVLDFVRAFPEHFAMRQLGSIIYVGARRRTAFPGARRLARVVR